MKLWESDSLGTLALSQPRACIYESIMSSITLKAETPTKQMLGKMQERLKQSRMPKREMAVSTKVEWEVVVEMMKRLKEKKGTETRSSLETG